MVATGYEPIVTMPTPSPRPFGLLVGTATLLTGDDGFNVEGRDRLGLGVKYQPWGCAPLTAGNSDCDAQAVFNQGGNPYDSAGDLDGTYSSLTKADAVGSIPDEVIQPAFLVVDGLACSTLSFPDLNMLGVPLTNRLRARMRLLMSRMLTMELITGWASQGISLNSEATTLAASTSMDDVAQAIEGHLASVLLGQQGTVHIPPALLHQAMDIGWVHLIDGSLRTGTGHKVIADAGNLGDPDDPTESAPSTWTIFGSGEVYYRVGDTVQLWDIGDDTFNWETNIRERLVEARAQLLFDPCSVGSTVLTLP